MPRPKVQWDTVAAVISYDAQIATSGITTVLDSLRVWREEGAEDVDGQAAALSQAHRPRPRRRPAAHRAFPAFALRGADAESGRRCRRTDRPAGRAPDVADGPHAGPAPVPRSAEAARILPRQERRHERRRAGCAICTAHRKPCQSCRRRIIRGWSTLAGVHGTPLASHDDTTAEHVEQAVLDRVAIAEFPTTVGAAAALHAAGVKVMMGAPNLIRGGSHSGNVATADLARAGMLDLMSSDYVPSSLLIAALRLPEAAPNYDLPAAIRTVSKTPADAVGLTDRGEIAVGKRADLIRVHQRRRCRRRAQRLERRQAGRMTARRHRRQRRADRARTLVAGGGPERRRQGHRDRRRQGSSARKDADDRVSAPGRDPRRDRGRRSRQPRTMPGFRTRAAHGAFAFWWQAHGLTTASRRSVEDDIRAGRTVICNVSRGVVEDAAGALSPCDVRPDHRARRSLAARLAGRSRASDGSLEDRIKRNAMYADFSADIVIDNSGALEEAVNALMSALRDNGAR